MFEWDENKNLLNLEKHGILFEDACRIFDDYVFKTPDRRFDYGEARFLALGNMDGTIIAAVFTEREGNIRMISARHANRTDRKRNIRWI
jgi:uncharacterized DUF497 family protein